MMHDVHTKVKLRNNLHSLLASRKSLWKLPPSSFWCDGGVRRLKESKECFQLLLGARSMSHAITRATYMYRRKEGALDKSWALGYG